MFDPINMKARQGRITALMTRYHVLPDDLDQFGDLRAQIPSSAERPTATPVAQDRRAA